MFRFSLLASVVVFQSVFACTAFSQDAAKSRTWTSDKGHKIGATLVENGTDAVKLKKDTGKTIEVKISKLSEADQKYLSRLREREQEDSEPVEPKSSESVSNKPEVTEDDLFEMGKELELPSYGGSIRNPFTSSYSSKSSSRSWNGISVAYFEVVNSKNRTEVITGWRFESNEDDRKNVVKLVNQYIKEKLKDKRGQFSTKAPIPDWLKAEKATSNSRKGTKVNFQLFMYFGEQTHLLVAAANSPERLELLVKSIGTFSEKTPEEPSFDKKRERNTNGPEPEQVFEEEFRIWKDSTGEFEINATLIEVSVREVTLETRSGKEIRMATKKLSREDRRFAMEAWAAQMKKRFDR